MFLLRLWLPVVALLLFSNPADAKYSVFMGLGELPGGPFASYARGVSPDGLVVVGQSRSTSALEAFRWSKATGMEGLGLPSGHTGNSAGATSTSGSVVVGSGGPQGGAEAFRWTRAGGMVGLGYLTGGSVSTAAGVSADGSVVVGRSYSTGGLCPLDTCVLAYRWTQADTSVMADRLRLMMLCLAGAVLGLGCAGSSGGPPPTPRSDFSAAASAQRVEIVRAAESMIGRPYRYGGASPSGFDCSGLVLPCGTYQTSILGHWARTQPDLPIP